MFLNMYNFYSYLYYRIYQFYKGSMRSYGPLALFVSLNVSFIFNVFFRLLTMVFYSSSSQPNGLDLIFADIFFMALSSIIVFPILIYSKRKVINKKMDQFKKESPEERKKKGKEVAWYITLSVLGLVISYLGL